MKTKLLLIPSIFFYLLTFSQPQNNEIGSLIQPMVVNESVMGVSAAYAVNGRLIAIAAAGLANKNDQTPFTVDTKVRMGSIAKTMTAIAVLQLVEDGRIDLDAPIQNYIEDYPKQEKTQITTRHLLSHTSGISGYKNGRESNTTQEYKTLSEALNLFKYRELLFEPGTQYSYTTYGYTVLGVIIERVSGKTFEAYMQEHVWNVAEMKNTGIEKYKETVTDKSELYTRKKGKGKAEAVAENNLSNRIPAGGFYSTVGDLIKFGNAILNHSLINEPTFDLMRTHHSLEKRNNSYGFGWFLYGQAPNEGAIIGHPGAQNGCTSFLFIVPSKKVVSVILANTSRAQSEVDPVANDLLNLALKAAEK